MKINGISSDSEVAGIRPHNLRCPMNNDLSLAKMIFECKIFDLKNNWGAAHDVKYSLVISSEGRSFRILPHSCLQAA